jgi:hypothetical protein
MVHQNLPEAPFLPVVLPGVRTMGRIRTTTLTARQGTRHGTGAAENSVPDWLAAPWQRLAEVTGGAVFHDGTRRADPGQGGAPRPRHRTYFSRPYQVLGAGRFAVALSGAVTDPLVGGSGRPARRIRSSTARRPSANSVMPGPLPRYLVSDRDMSVLGVGDTQT